MAFSPRTLAELCAALGLEHDPSIKSVVLRVDCDGIPTATIERLVTEEEITKVCGIITESQRAGFLRLLFDGPDSTYPIPESLQAGAEAFMRGVMGPVVRDQPKQAEGDQPTIVGPADA